MKRAAHTAAAVLLAASCSPSAKPKKKDSAPVHAEPNYSDLAHILEEPGLGGVTMPQPVTPNPQISLTTTTARGLSPSPTGTPQPPSAENSGRSDSSASPLSDVGPAAPTSDVEAAISQTFHENPRYAIATFTCESGLRPDADENPPHAGIAQINTRIHAERIADMGYTTADMYTLWPNLLVARALYNESGWGPWECAA